MREGWTRLELREVLTRDEDRVPVDAGRLYAGLGVLRDGQGLFVKDPFVGGETSYGSLTRVRSGQVVLRTITAWESPIGVVTDEQDGGFVSPSVFPAFTVDRARLDPRFMALLCQSPRFWAEMRIRTTGTVLRRQTLSAEGLLSIPVNLPPLDEQRRIVDLIRSLDATITASDQAVAKAEQAERSVVSSLLMSQWTDESLRPLPELVDILDAQRRPINAEERGRRQGSVPYYGASGQAGWIDAPLFNEDLVLLGEDAIDFLNPAAKKAYAISGPSWVNNHAHVLRPREGCVLQTFLVDALNRVDYAHFVGFGTRSKLTQGAMKQIRIPAPTISAQRVVVGVSQSFHAELTALRAAADHARNTRAALLAELLCGRHEIPPTYDRLLEAT